jgi:putative peptidoglycan lipid II flippase
MFIWRQDVVGLVTGVLLGGCLQIIIQIPPLLKKGIVFNETRLFHPQIKKIARLLIPRVFGAGVYHINVVIGTQLASIERIVGEGAVAALYFSSRIWQLPLAIFPIALAQAALPTLSSHIAARQADKFRSSINFLLRSVSFLMLPASAGLIALSFPITRVLFQRGEFGAYSTQITSYALLFYSIGLFSYGVIKILVNAFYSMQDTKTPVKVATLSLGVNVILSIMLMFRLRVGGIALANSVSGIFNAAMLYIILKRKIGAFDGKGLLGSFFRILAASVLMGIFVFLLNRHLVLFFSTPKTAYLAAALIISMAAGILFYIIVCHILQIEELKELRIWLLKKR